MTFKCMSVHPSVLHLSIRLSVHIEKIGSNWTDFRETLFVILLRSSEEIFFLKWTKMSHILGERGQHED